MFTITDDISSPEFMSDPYPTMERWRRESPIHWLESHKAWCVTRYSEVREALLDHTNLSNDVMRPYIRNASRSNHELHYLWSCLGIWLTFVDQPIHKRIRSTLNSAFLPDAIADMRPAITKQIEMLLARMLTKGTRADFVTNFAYLLPAYTIGGMLGVPDADLDRLTSWSDRLARFVFISMREPGISRYAAAVQALQEMRDYFFDLVESRRSIKGNLVIDKLIAAEDADGKLSNQEVVATCMLLLFAGHETTSMYLTNSLRALFIHPQQRSMLLDCRHEPEFVRNAIRELLRWDSASFTLIRLPKEEHQIAGVSIPAASRLYLFIASANRDETVFRNADELQLDRPDAKRVITMGQGIHSCLGTHLVYLESEIVFPILLERLHNWELEPSKMEFTDMLAFRSSKHLPMRIKGV